MVVAGIEPVLVSEFLQNGMLLLYGKTEPLGCFGLSHRVTTILRLPKGGEPEFFEYPLREGDRDVPTVEPLLEHLVDASPLVAGNEGVTLPFREFLHRDSGRDRWGEPVTQPRAHTLIGLQEHGLSQYRQSEHNPEQVEREIGTGGVCLDLVKQVPAELVPAVSKPVALDPGVMSPPRFLPHHIFWLDQHRTEEEIFLPIEYSVVDRRAEESSESERIVLALGFQMTAERFGAGIDTEHGLRLGSRTLVTVVVCGSLPLTYQPRNQGVSIFFLVCLVPNRTERVRREPIEPGQQRPGIRWWQVLKILRAKLEELRHMEEAPDVPADSFRVRVVRVGMGVDVLQIMGSCAFEEIGKCRVDAQRAPTDFLGQLSLVKHAHGQVFQRIDWVTALFRIIRVLLSPANKAGPAG